MSTENFARTPVTSLGSGDPIHAPLDTADVTIPASERWIDTPPPPTDSSPAAPLDSEDRSWAGLRAFNDEPNTFEPSVDPVASDQWADEVPTEIRSLTAEQTTVQNAEALAAQGDLGGALGIYQDLAERTPNDPRLWQRIEELAKALQRQSNPPD